MSETGAELLVDCLEAEGVEYVFGLPGEELAELMVALEDSSVAFVPVRHEQGAAFMADVWGRLTGEAGVCLSTLGPGATNLLTGVADAHLDKSPLVAITGQGARERLHQESHQRLDVVDMYRAIVEWNTQLDDTAIIAESVRKAFKLAEWEKPGATHLELPEDVAAESVAGEPLPTRQPVARAEPNEGAIDRAVEHLAAADQPLVLAGNGAVRADASERLQAFVEATGVPVVSTYMAKGAVPDSDPHSLMTLDSGPDGQAGGAVAAADCVLAVGYDIAEHDPEGWNPDGQKTVLHLDHEPAEVYEHYNPEVELVADVAAGLRRLTDAVDVSWDTWCRDAHDAVVAAATERPDPEEPFSVRGTLPLLRDAMADDDVLVSDVGSHKMAIAKHYPAYEPNTCIVSNGLASMGIGVPGGVAADLAVDGNVVVATGDGGFLMNAAELNTADRLDASFTVLLFNDDEYGLITEEFEREVGESPGTRLTNPEFVTFAESFGIEARRPETWDDLDATLEAAVDSEELTLVEVPLP
ncbi:acetolactate synthase large subunit [Halorarius halobius]|uniref:acetolactate synthase large subunit n=1 Tax=Halorarius halobius TaxID=2962671 RepID=UPI0020CDD856|nr:acetolactate synthase large subunit [Halorarius halobius]